MIDTPIENLKVQEIKDELRRLYDIKDFSDCVELNELQKKLATVRETQLITRGLKYGPLLRIGNQKNPSGVVTLMHGLGDTAHGWEDTAEHLARRLPHILFLLPTAPHRAVTINGGMSMPAWYDIRSLAINSAEREDGEGVLASADYVKSLAYVTSQRHRIPNGRVIFAGFSQGAATAMAAGLTARIAPAAVIAMSGYLAAAADVVPRLSSKLIPLLMCHGTHDAVVPLEMAQKSKEALEKAGVNNIVFKTYPMDHSSHPQEIEDVEKFIAQMLPASTSKT